MGLLLNTAYVTIRMRVSIVSIAASSLLLVVAAAEDASVHFS